MNMGILSIIYGTDKQRIWSRPVLIDMLNMFNGCEVGLYK